MHGSLGPTPPLKIDGKPFLPLGLYDVSSMDEVAVVKEAGFNLIETYPRFLREHPDPGLKCILWLSNMLEPDRLKATIEEFKDYSSIIAYYIVDEPDGARRPVPEVLRAYRIAKETDPSKPVFTVLCVPGLFHLYTDTCDVLGLDPYPFPHGSLEYVTRTFNSGLAATGCRKPIWGVPQAFDWDAFDNEDRDKILFKPEEHIRPLPSEARLLAYLELIHGATGLVFYTFKARKWRLTEHPRLWEAVRRVVQEVSQLAHAILSPETVPAYADPGRGGLPTVYTLAKKAEDGVYLLAANPSHRFLRNVKIYLGEGDADVDVLFEDRAVELSDGTLTDDFKPLEVHVYRIEDLAGH